MKTPGLFATLLFLLLSRAALAQQSPWVSTHGPCDDAIQTFATHPSGNLFLGTNDNGVYRRNLNNPWLNVSVGIEGSNIQDFLVRPSGAILACGNGIVRSLNLGNSWSTLWPNEFLMSIAANSSGHLFAGAWASVLRSTNNGTTWERLQNDLPTAWVQAIEVEANDNLIAGTTFGILRSTNSGQNWTFIGPTPFPAPIDLQDLAMNANGWIIAPVFWEGIYVSTNSGDSWALTSAGLEDLLPRTVALDNQNRILAGSYSGSLYESTNAGSFWNRINPQFRFSTVEALLIDVSGVYAGTGQGGVFCTTNGGATWRQKNEGIAVAPIYKLVTNSQGTVFARGYALMWRSPDQGETWIPTTFGDDGGSNLAVSAADHLFAPLGFGSGARSTDDGDTWTSLPIGSYVAEFGFASNGNVFAAGGGFYRSTNNGDSWNLISSPDGLTTFAVDVHDHMVGGTIFGHALRSTDGGFLWGDAGALTPHAFIDTYVDSENRMFLASHDGGGLFRSTNDGVSWQPLTNGLMDSAIWCVTGSADGELFVATDTQGVFRSGDHGDTWETFSSGLPAGTISSVTTTDQGFVYASLPGGGVYQAAASATDVTPAAVVHPFALEQNAPNPFHPITIIRYTLDRPSEVKLKIYDVGGRCVAQLVDQSMDAGAHVATFDASALPSGVYTYVLSTATLREARKMVVTR